MHVILTLECPPELSRVVKSVLEGHHSQRSVTLLGHLLGRRPAPCTQGGKEGQSEKACGGSWTSMITPKSLRVDAVGT